MVSRSKCSPEFFDPVLRQEPGEEGPCGFLWCPAGSYRRGSDEDSEEVGEEERPAHQVTLTRGFWMKQTPVVQAEWEAVAGFNPSHFKESGPLAPVEGVSWFEAVWFCNLLSKKEGLPEAYSFSRITGVPGQGDRRTPGEGDFQIGSVRAKGGSWGYRLPTEAEWEYACRAGNACVEEGSLDDLAWSRKNSGGRTHPVLQKKPNAWGLHDMLGNVWEWCFDVFGAYDACDVCDPVQSQGPRLGRFSTRVLRGGAWSSHAERLRCSAREKDAAPMRSGNLGFRIARFPRQGG